MERLLDTTENGLEFRTALVIVVYNQYCGNSVTCKTIKEGSKRPDIILIIDNSTREMNNQQYCEKEGWHYHSMEGNAGLTKAYNAAISILKNKADFVIWADDDTFFPPDYLEKLMNCISRTPTKDVFLPVVKSTSGMLSPAVYTQRRIVPVNELSEIKNRQVSAINSGMVVRLSLYDNYSYDETMFLDYVDHDFMYWCNQNGKNIQIMEDVLLFQSFFDDEKSPSIEAIKHRMKIFCKDIRVFERKCGKSRVLTELDLLRYCYYRYRKILKIWLKEKLMH